MSVTARRPRPAARHLATALALGLVAALAFSASAQAVGATALAWGGDAAGQLGDGAARTSGCECSPVPVPVAGLAGVTQIAAGPDFSLALRADGTVLAWGENGQGQLGNGTTVPNLAPIAVTGLSNVVQLAAGELDGLALLADGTVKAWGSNGFGRLGAAVGGPDQCGGFDCSKVPVTVPGLSDVVAIAAGALFDLALRADGTVVAWGEDHVGEAGDLGLSPGGVSPPAPVPGVSGAMAISAGRISAYALLRDGTVESWGHDTFGELGDGVPLSSTAGSCDCRGPVTVAGLHGADAISAFGAGAVTRLSSGAVDAWGGNTENEVGTGTPSAGGCECIPAPVATSGLSRPLALASGDTHNLALLPDGSVQAWGFGESGQAANGTSERPVPGPVDGVAGASGIAAGEADSFALIGPSQTLKVVLAGNGRGVVGGAQGILCGSSCQNSFPQGQAESLRAEATDGGRFAGFSGPCQGLGPCQVRLDTDQTVTATFGAPKGTRLTKVTIKARKRTASFSYAAPGAVTGFQCALARPARPHSGKRRPLKPHFSRCGRSRTFRHLAPGRYVFEVRALDLVGADPRPAERGFAIRP